MTPRRRERSATFLGVAHVARELCVAQSTVRAWIKADRIIAIQMPGGNYRIPASELARILTPRK